MEYWESVLKECNVAISRTRLNEIHLDMLQHQLEKLRVQKQAAMAAAAKAEIFADSTCFSIALF